MLSIRLAVVHPYYGILLTNKNRQSTDTNNYLMDLKNFTLSEKKYNLKRSYCMTPFIKHSEMTKPYGNGR